jgi:DNA-binding CsgD family transcriptional regulator
MSTNPLSPRTIPTRRESEIAHLIAEGKTRKEVAELLSLSQSTVNFHLENLFKRLGGHVNAIDITRLVMEGKIPKEPPRRVNRQRR